MHSARPAATLPLVASLTGPAPWPTARGCDQHKEHHPATGLVHRVNLYYLDNGYWDCYREGELQAT